MRTVTCMSNSLSEGQCSWYLASSSKPSSVSCCSLEDSGDNLILRWCWRINIYLTKFDTVISCNKIWLNCKQNWTGKSELWIGIVFWWQSGSDFSFWCRYRSGSYPKLLTCWKIRILFLDFYSQQCQSRSLHCFVFLVSVIGAISISLKSYRYT
jgi:hypothetical protein